MADPRLAHAFRLVAAWAMLCWGAAARGEQFAVGEREVPTTIALAKVGNALEGRGSTQHANGGQRGDDFTWLAWTGGASGPVVSASGSESIIRDLSIFGGTRLAVRDPAYQRPDVLVCVERGMPGIPTGRLDIENVVFGYAKVGLLIGRTEHDPQCAESDVRSVWFEGCETAVKSVNGQAIGWSYEMIRANGCGTIFLIEGGGKFTCDGLFTATPGTTLLKLRPTEAGVGHNNASYELRNVFLDNQAQNTCVLDMADHQYDGPVLLNRGKLTGAHKWTEPGFKLAGNARVTLRDYETLYPGMFMVSGTRTTRLLLENCCIHDGAREGWRKLFRELAPGVRVRVILENCYDQNGQPIDDASKLLKGEPEKVAMRRAA